VVDGEAARAGDGHLPGDPLRANRVVLAALAGNRHLGVGGVERSRHVHVALGGDVDVLIRRALLEKGDAPGKGRWSAATGSAIPSR
jgi:hypothetical protein